MKRSILLLLAAALLLPACVAKKKFLEESAQRQSFEKQSGQLQQDLKYAQSRIAEMDTTINELNALSRQLENDRGRLNTELKYKEQEIDRVINERLSQKQQFDAALQAKAYELETREKIIGDLQSAIAQRDEKLKGILTKLENVFQQYAADDLTIEIKKGKLYVALADKLLFESGSTKVDKRGREALNSLANILSKYPDVDIIVEGHTDNVPIRNKEYVDNWDLSVIRATNVVRILTKDFLLSPNQVTAAGRGEFQPKASNEAKEGRALNRRTEIVITPRLDSIFSILEQKK